jgi:hypothetical protein
MSLEPNSQSLLSKLEQYGARNPIDVFLWGLVAGTLGTIVILTYALYSA